MHVILDFHQDATIVKPFADDYRSMDDARLQRLREDLRESADRLTSGRMILDLTRVTCFGAALLGVLADISRQLRSRHQMLLVCGDTHGLLRLTRLDEFIPVRASVSDALAVCQSRFDGTDVAMFPQEVVCRR